MSEFFAAELAVVLNCGRGGVSHPAHRAWIHRSNLPGTWAAPADGVLDETRAKVPADVLAHTTPEVARGIEARVQPQAAHLTTGRMNAGALARATRPPGMRPPPETRDTADRPSPDAPPYDPPPS